MFTPKQWKNTPDESTPLSAEALIDLETRVTNYADTRASEEASARNAALAGKADASHTHGQDDIDGLADALDEKADAEHTHAQSDVTGLSDALAGKADATHSHAQSDITGLATTLDGKAEVEHTHAQEDIDGLSDALTGKQDTSEKGEPGGYASLDDDGLVPESQLPDIGGASTAEEVSFEPAAGLSSENVQDAIEEVVGLVGEGQGTVVTLDGATRASLDFESDAEDIRTALGVDTPSDPREPSAHTHEQVDIEGLAESLSGKADAEHTHDQEDIEGLSTALSGKADAEHSHDQSDIDGLETALSGKADSEHTHDQSDIDGLTTALSGKANATHTHQQSDITGLSTALSGKANTSHTHEQSDITGLSDALSGKADSSDSRFPTSGQKSALAGTEGTPGDANRYVTDEDSRLAVYYVWDSDAEEYVAVEDPVRTFLGPMDPADAGFTLREGDVWDPTVEEEA